MVSGVCSSSTQGLHCACGDLWRDHELPIHLPTEDMYDRHSKFESEGMPQWKLAVVVIPWQIVAGFWRTGRKH